MSVTQEYLDLHNKYMKLYGSKTVVFLMIGSFFELYSVKGDGPDLYAISKILNIQNTHRDKSKPESLGNPMLSGFHCNSLEKFLETLINDDYTVVVYNQKIELFPDAKKVIDRRVVTRVVGGIYTKSTYINNLNQSSNNYLMCVYITNEDQKNSPALISVGVSCVDLSTGDVRVHSAFSEKFDENIALDQAVQFVHAMNPSELLIYYDNQSKIKKNVNMKDYLYKYFNVDSNKCRYYEEIDAKYKKILFQNELLRKVYPDSASLLSPIELLSLEREPNVVISLCLMFDFIYDKIPSLLKSIKHPDFCFDNTHLVLSNNAIRQLNIFESENSANCNAKYKSLFDIVNMTRTPMGQRYLRSILSSPLTSKNALNKIYDTTEKMIKLKIADKIKNNLDSVRDIERLAHRLELKMIRPYEIPLFITSYKNIVDIINILNETKDFYDILKDVNIKEINKFMKHVNDIFILENLSLCTDLSFDKQIEIFQKGTHKDIDEICNNINSGTDTIDILRDELFKLFPKSKFSNSGKVLVKHNERDGFYLKLTKKNAEILQKLLEDVKVLDVSSKKIKVSDLKFSYNKDTAKITIPSLNEHADSLDEYAAQIAQLYKENYLKDIEIIHNKFHELFVICNEMITKIDYLQSNAKMSMTWAYCKPIIDARQYGYIDAKQARNPLVERLVDTEYVPLDVCIGHPDFKTMMIFGLNSAGKSVAMLMISLCVYLAQCGMYVPAKSFTFSPYHAIMTRISSNDNIFKNLSSFAVEMSEVNSILKRSDEYSLIVSDELCHSTEATSGTAIVASCIISLTKKKSTNVITTHLHNIMGLDEIKAIDNIKAFHMKCSYDEKTDSLIYTRTMENGSGDSVYGVAVARHMIKDTDFIDQANVIKNRLLKQDASLISGKKSRYADVYVTECSICGKKDVLESHHLNAQKLNDEFGNVKGKEFMKMHSSQNIAILCSHCHDEIHANKKTITGYVATSRGRKLI
jgi:DNA mismatch repair protein MutS